MSENVSGTGTAKSNYAGSQEELLDHAKLIVKQALIDLTQSDRKGLDGTAGQRMAAAILYEYEALKMGSPAPRNLADYMGKIDAKERTNMLTLYINHMIGVMPTNPRGEAAKAPSARVHPANVLHDMQTEWRRQRALVQRGLELASVLVKGSIPMDQFNEKTGLWTVTRALFCKPGFKVMGDETLTTLNGKSFFAGKDVAGKNVQLDKINASVTRLLAAHRAPRAGGTQTGTNGTTGQTDQSKANAAGLDQNINALYAILNAKNSDKNWTPNVADFGRPLWNKLQDIARMVNDWASNESFFLKPVAKPAQKAEAKKAA